MILVRKILKFILLIFIGIFISSCSSNNDILIIRGDGVSLYSHEPYLINNINDEHLNSLNKYEEIEKYDEDFFTNKSLVLIITKADSSSIHYEVKKINYDKDKLIIDFVGISKRYVTMDLLSQYIFLEINKEEALLIQEIILNYDRVYED